MPKYSHLSTQYPEAITPKCSVVCQHNTRRPSRPKCSHLSTQYPEAVTPKCSHLSTQYPEAITPKCSHLSTQYPGATPKCSYLSITGPSYSNVYICQRNTPCPSHSNVPICQHNTLGPSHLKARTCYATRHPRGLYMLASANTFAERENSQKAEENKKSIIFQRRGPSVLTRGK